MILKHTYIFLFALFIVATSCNTDDDMPFVEKEIVTESFTKIIVNDNIKLVLVESNRPKTVIQSWDTQLDKITATVTDNTLTLTNNNTINYNSNYGITTVTVYSPNITSVRNSSNFTVTNMGPLNFDSLSLVSENYLSDYLNAGDFNLNINTNNLNVVANGLSVFKLTGTANAINVNFAGGNPRFEAKDLLSKTATIFGRSTNDIILNTSNKVSGNLYSSGDLVLYQKPTELDLNIYYIGKVVPKY